jgi:hypothetical protein
MFFSKTPGTLVKHLPAATLKALATTGASDKLQQYSLLTSQIHAFDNRFETFETGPVLLSYDDPKTSQKVEVIVENDSLNGDDDNLELSFRSYKDKETQHTPFLPRLIFSMKMEGGVWKLNEIDLNVRLPLTDPDLLKSMTDAMNAKPRATARPDITSPVFQSQPPARSNNLSSTLGTDASVLSAMRTIIAAENTYRSTYRGVGYTCTMSDLDGFGGGEPNEHQAMLIPSSLASGRRFGFVFSLSGCNASPAASFVLTAAPANNYSGRKAFCADQSGAIRSSDDGNPASCLSKGTPVQ